MSNVDLALEFTNMMIASAPSGEQQGHQRQ